MGDNEHDDVALAAGESLYAYALTPEPLHSVTGATGVNDAPTVFVAGVAGLGLTLDRVDTVEWTGDESDEKLKKLEWVAPRAVRHEEVVSTTAEAGQAFPLPFGTLFSSLDELRDRIESYGDLIDRYFAETTGCHEWSVKGVIDRDRIEEHLMGGDDGPASGSDYLRKRKKVQQTRKEVEPWLNELVTPFWEELVDLTRQHRVLSTKTSRQASDEDVVFNWAFLVADDDRVAFERRIDAFHAANHQEGVELRLSGPWAPYSFRPVLPEED